jgi:hypothetical protein
VELLLLPWSSDLDEEEDDDEDSAGSPHDYSMFTHIFLLFASH